MKLFTTDYIPPPIERYAGIGIAVDWRGFTYTRIHPITGLYYRIHSLVGYGKFLYNTPKQTGVLYEFDLGTLRIVT
jgi:hypothetical protein